MKSMIHGCLLGTALALLCACGSLGGDDQEGEESEEQNEASTTDEAAAPPLPTIVLEPAQAQRAEGLIAHIDDGQFAGAEQVRANARLFLYLAASDHDASVIAPSLLAMSHFFTFRGDDTESRELADLQYIQVVRHHLESSEPTVQGAAMRAAGVITSVATLDAQLSEAANDVNQKLAEYAANHPSPAGRYEAIAALVAESTSRERDRSPPRETSMASRMPPEAVAAFLTSLDASEPWVVSIALLGIESVAPQHPDRATLVTRLVELVSHEDPGVRGRAARALPAAAAGQQALIDRAVAALLPLLEDASAYTKSEAMTALAALDHRPAIHLIMPMTTDSTSNVYRLRGFTNLLGEPGTAYHNGSQSRRLDDAALSAIRTYAAQIGGERPFGYRVPHPNFLDRDLGTAASNAGGWYRRHRAEIPEGDGRPQQ